MMRRARHCQLFGALLAAFAVLPAHALTPLSTVRYTPDITVSLNGALVGPSDVANDDLSGTPTLALSGLPANVAAFHYTGSAHWLVFDTTVPLPGGLTATPRDVVSFDGATYALILDGAAAGIPAGVAIDALSSTNGVDLLLSFDTTATVGAVTAAPEDLVRYAGAWSAYFVGSTAGVPAGANLDAVFYLPSTGHLLVSFDVAGSVGGVNFTAGDVLEYTPTGPVWEMAFSPASRYAGWGAANLRGLWALQAPPGTPPVMGNVPDQSASVGSAFSLGLSGYVALTEANPITGYAIASGSLPPGLTLDAGSGVISGTPSTAGTYNVTVTAGDVHGASNADAIQFTVAAAPPPGTPPVMGNVPDQSASVGSAFSVGLSGYVTLTESNPITGYAIASGSLPPGLGLNAGSGVISGTPSTAGTYNVTVTASDVDGTSNADAVQFTIAAAPPADPPVAGSDTYNTPYNTALTIAVPGVLGNDTDPNSDPLTVAVWVAPANGILTATSAGGGFTYTPTAGYSGADSFTYTVSDGTGGTAVATVTVTVGSGGPGVTSVPTLSEWGLILLSTLIGLAGFSRLGRGATRNRHAA